MKLSLETKCKEHELIKNYLEENASEILADKINNGVQITKDNKTLVNKKTLETFMSFATEEAKKLASKEDGTVEVKGEFCEKEIFSFNIIF